jgi:hypothetical protein
MSKILLATRAWLPVGYVEYASGLCMEGNTKWIWKENWGIMVDSAESKNAMGRSGSTIGSRCSIFCHLLDYFRASKLIISMLCWTKFQCIENMPFDVKWHFVIMRFLTKFHCGAGVASLTRSSRTRAKCFQCTGSQFRSRSVGRWPCCSCHLSPWCS